MNASNPLFVLQNIACARGGRLLFQNLSCALGRGDVLHLSGPNGAGKTSLLRIMAGALPPVEGELLWDGKKILENGAGEHAKRFGYLPPEDRSLKILETANENLQFWAALDGQPGDCAHALARLGLSAQKDVPVRRLSAGQRRRLSLARVVSSGRVLWLLDEPFNGLDAGSLGLFRRALNDHAAAGGIAVIASHHPVDPPKAGALRRIELGGAA